MRTVGLLKNAAITLSLTCAVATLTARQRHRWSPRR
jgi:hypothetical protein